MRLVGILFFLLHSAVYSQSIRTLEVYFQRGNPALSDNSKDSLTEFLQRLGSHRILSVKITGYCDEERVPLFNLTLSERRAKAVYDYLEGTGRVRSEIMSYRGNGRTGAKTKNYTEVQVTYTDKNAPLPEAKKPRTSINKDSLLAGKSIRLNLNFYPGESTLLPSAIPYMRELEKFMKDNPEIRIEIAGHVCCSNNMQLSLDRAQEIYDQLVKKGIDATRLTYRGYGNSRPLVEEEKEEDREMNRRVEIKLIKR